MDAETIENQGFLMSDPFKKRKKPVSKDPNPESFWNEFPKIQEITQLKCMNPKWGSTKICKVLSYLANERMVRKVLGNYFYDERSGNVFKKSIDLDVSHRRCCTKEEMIALVRRNHEIDHRKSAAIYESIRRSVFPVVRETVKVLFDAYVSCEQCNSAVDLPQTRATRKPIPATPPNSRSHIDLKKMPPHRGYNYVCNIVDCYSRFAFGKATKSKSAKEISGIVLHFIYIFGAPRILQSDNGKEFRNSDLEEVVKEFETVQMHGRPYHPQSQGRVERFNRTMTDYFRIKMSTCSDWPDQLEEFYYSYNNRLNKATRPSTPYQLFYRRPNFSAPVDEQVPYATLTKEEREFLARAHMDVDEVVEARDTDEVTDDYSDNNQQEQQNVQEFMASEGTESSHCSEEIEQTASSVGIVASHHHVQSSVSDYYKSIYNKSFSEDTEQEIYGFESPPKMLKTSNVTEFYRENHRQVLGEYPLEQFSDNLVDETEYFPQEGHAVYFRPIPSMNKGTAVFISGFWRKGFVTSTKKTNGGRVYKVRDTESANCFDLNRKQIRERRF